MSILSRSVTRFVRLAVLLAFCHWLVLVISSSIAIGRGVHRIDHPEFPLTALDRFCMVLVRILQEPLSTVERIVEVPPAWPGILVGVTFSLLWGAAIACCARLLSRRTVNE